MSAEHEAHSRRETELYTKHATAKSDTSQFDSMKISAMIKAIEDI